MKRTILTTTLAVASLLSATAIPFTPVSIVGAAAQGYVPPFCPQSRLLGPDGKWKTILDCPNNG